LGGVATLLAMSDVPVVMVHGWGGNFRETWQEPGWQALLNDMGRTVVGVDLLGHGTAPKPHDPAQYTDLSGRVTEAVPNGAFDAIGFSLGAITLLRMACTEPTRFRRLVLMGIGESVFRSDPDATNRIIAAVEGNGPADDIASQVFANYAHRQGNDPVALAAVFKRPRGHQLTPEDLAVVSCPVLVILGDRDFSGPGEPLVAALPNAKLVTLRNTDHFATTENFKAIDAVLEFLTDDQP
jgi:pimeloyl-ACP methyl ester carboxylesterase